MTYKVGTTFNYSGERYRYIGHHKVAGEYESKYINITRLSDGANFLATRDIFDVSDNIEPPFEYIEKISQYYDI